MGLTSQSGKFSKTKPKPQTSDLWALYEGINERFRNQIKYASETKYVGYAQIPDLPHDEESEIFHCKLKSWRLKPP